MLFFLKLILNTKSFSKSDIYCNLKMVKLLVMLFTKNLYAKINNFKCLWIFRDNSSEPFWAPNLGQCLLNSGPFVHLLFFLSVHNTELT